MNGQIVNIESMETITKKQLKEIVGYEYLNDFYNTYGIESYLHPDGKVTLDFEDDGITFDSRSDALNYLVPIFGMTISETHLLKGLMEVNERFVSSSKSLVEKLLIRVDLNSTSSDSSLLSLIDAYINNNKENSELLKEIYPSVVALVGELLIKHIEGATWEMRKDEVSGIMEPSIRTADSSKGVIPAFLIAYKEMFEYEQSALLDHMSIYY